MQLPNIDTKKLLAVAVLVSIISAVILVTDKGIDTYDQNSTLPMIVFENRDQLWQVVTYQDEPITSLVIDVYPKYKETYKSVYINHRSQFVFSDGSPVLLHEDPLFWNRKGDVVDYNYRKISESLIFTINGKGMENNTAMTLKDLKSNLRSNLIKARDKEMEKLVVERENKLRIK